MFFIKGKSVSSNGLRSLPINPPNCIILDSWVFADFKSAYKLFAKVFQSF